MPDEGVLHDAFISCSDLLTIQEAACLLRIAGSTLYAWVYQRRVPFRKHGRRLVFSRRDLERWSQAQCIQPLTDFRLTLRDQHDMEKVTQAERRSLKIERSIKRSSPPNEVKDD